MESSNPQFALYDTNECAREIRDSETAGCLVSSGGDASAALTLKRDYGAIMRTFEQSIDNRVKQKATQKRTRIVDYR